MYNILNKSTTIPTAQTNKIFKFRLYAISTGMEKCI